MLCSLIINRASRTEDGQRQEIGFGSLQFECELRLGSGVGFGQGGHLSLFREIGFGAGVVRAPLRPAVERAIAALPTDAYPLGSASG
eukprot:5258883-Pyramimonas_sp.AAC.4